VKIAGNDTTDNTTRGERIPEELGSRDTGRTLDAKPDCNDKQYFGSKEPKM
jgi:hypothetical protein